MLPDEKPSKRYTDVPRVDVFLWGIDIRHVRRPNPIDRRCQRHPEIFPRRYPRLFNQYNRRERKGIRLRLRPN